MIEAPLTRDRVYALVVTARRWHERLGHPSKPRIVTPGEPDSFEAMLFFVPLAVRHKTPTVDQFILKKLSAGPVFMEFILRGTGRAGRPLRPGQPHVRLRLWIEYPIHHAT